MSPSSSNSFSRNRKRLNLNNQTRYPYWSPPRSSELPATVLEFVTELQRVWFPASQSDRYHRHCLSVSRERSRSRRACALKDHCPICNWLIIFLWHTHLNMLPPAEWSIWQAIRNPQQWNGWNVPRGSTRRPFGVAMCIKNSRLIRYLLKD